MLLYQNHPRTHTYKVSAVMASCLSSTAAQCTTTLAASNYNAGIEQEAAKLVGSSINLGYEALPEGYCRRSPWWAGMVICGAICLSPIILILPICVVWRPHNF